MDEKIKKAIKDLDNGHYTKALFILRDEGILSWDDIAEIEQEQPYCEPSINKLRELIRALPSAQ
jgi:hypothetical protein